MLKKGKLLSMAVKNWPLLPLMFLIVCFPFEHKRYEIFKTFSATLYEKFQATSSFDVNIPTFIEKTMHFHLSDLLIIGIACFLFLKKELTFRTFFFDKKSRFLTFLFLSALISILLSECSSYSYLYFSLFNLSIACLAYQVTYHGLKNKHTLLHSLFWAVMMIGVFESCVGIGQFLMQKNLGLRSFGEHKLNLDKIGHQLAVIPLPEKGRAFFNLFSSLPKERTQLLRAYGTLPHPNFLAGFLVLTLLLSNACYLAAKRLWQKSCALFFIAIEFFALCLTFSRAGIFAFFISSLMWFLFANTKRWGVSMHKRSIKVLACFMITLFLVCFASLFPYFKARGGLVNYNSFAKGSDQHRITCQNIAIEAIKSRPICGVGFNCFTFFPEKYLNNQPQTRDRPHNIYLLLFAEMGLLGFACFSLFVFQVVRPMFMRPKSPYTQALCAVFFAFLLIGLCDLYFLIHQTGRLMFFIAAGLLSATAPKKESASVKNRVSLNIKNKAASA